MLSKFIREFQRTAKITLIALTITPIMHAQEKFSSYMNKIFFNVFTGSPDSSIHSFLSEFAPLLLHPPKNTTTWTAYPAIDYTPPVVITHSYIFYKHPFIDAAIKQGEFKVYTNVFNDNTYHNETSIKGIQLTFEFEKLDDATRLFEQYRKDLSAIPREEAYIEEKSRRFCEIYSDEENLYNIPCGVRITLGTEKNTNSLYEVNFR